MAGSWLARGRPHHLAPPQWDLADLGEERQA